MTGLRLLDVTFGTPAQNLACDEALLDELEAGFGEPTLRFWESHVPFVVLGYSNSIATEVNRAECQRRGIPILRRSSGGGSVVQGFGCLNYNLALPIEDETASITQTNCFVMRRHRDALAALLRQEVTDRRLHRFDDWVAKIQRECATKKEPCAYVPWLLSPEFRPGVNPVNSDAPI